MSGATEPELPGASPSQGEADDQPWTLSVRNTFLHVSDNSATWARSTSAPPEVTRAGHGSVGRQSEVDGSARTEASPRDTSSSANTSNSEAEEPARVEERALSSKEERPQDHAGPPLTMADPMTVMANGWTTLMLRNLPQGMTRVHLVELLEVEGFRAAFDFVHVPLHFADGHNFGYAFVNFCSVSDASRFCEHFTSFAWPSELIKILETHVGPGARPTTNGQVAFSTSLNGLEANVERYRDSRLMHPLLGDIFRPALFKAGERVPLPPMTKKVRAPRKRWGKEERQRRDAKRQSS
mmetsp:Transcript_113035/g.352313  ORF Transcript_113035/g.352313 Transcript_113035/m.352313 type:complete len:296 (+) Transcript_113035:87-974(+)